MFTPLSDFGSQSAQTSPDPKWSPLNIEDEEETVKEEVPLSVYVHEVSKVLLDEMKGLQDSNSDLKKEMEVLFYTCMYLFDNLLVYLLSSIILHYNST